MSDDVTGHMKPHIPEQHIPAVKLYMVWLQIMATSVLYPFPRIGRALLLLVALCYVLSLSSAQDFAKLAKVIERAKNKGRALAELAGKQEDTWKGAEGHLLSRLFGLPQEQQDGQSRPGESVYPLEYSEACTKGWVYLNNTKKTNLMIPIPLPLTVYAIDAFGKPGAGILDGNFYAYGSYDECLGIDHTKYCLVNVDASGFVFQTATCVPVECNTTDIVQTVNASFAQYIKAVIPLPVTPVVNSTGIICDTQGEPPFSDGAIAMITVCSLMAFLVLLSSAFDWILNSLGSESVQSLKLLINHDGEPGSMADIEIHEKEPLLNGTAGGARREKSRHADSKIVEFLTAFSLFKIIPTIMSTKQPPSAITSINGIRTISMFWVILGHTHLWVLYVSKSDNIEYMFGDVTRRFTFQAIVNATVAVDSFFFLSGLLMAYLTLRQMAKRNGNFPILHFYIHRFLRLTPTYAFLLFFYWFLTVHIGDGPNFVAGTGPGSELDKQCKNYWWTNLLYINNVYPWKMGDECMGWTWYLANDMQFFIVAPLMVIPLYYCMPLGLSIVGIFLVGSLASRAGIAGYYGFDASFMGTAAQNNDLPTTASDELYIKPYARIPTYLVGIILGYILHRKLRLPFHVLINWPLYILMFCVGAVCLAAPLYGLYDTWHGHTLSDAENVFYYTFNRFSWSVGLALLVFVCHNGYGWIINSFLSMRIWVPLGRLTFTAYLVHEIILTIMFGSLRTPLHYNDYTLVIYAVGCVVLAYGAAAVFAVFVEFPFSNLETAIFKAIGLGVRESTRHNRDFSQGTKLESK